MFIGFCDFNYFLGVGESTSAYGKTVDSEESNNLWQFAGGNWEEFPELFK